MNKILKQRKVTAWLILLTFLFTCVVPTGTAFAKPGSADGQVENAGGKATATGKYDIEVSKTIKAIEGKENYFDITLQTTTHRHHVDMSTDVIIVMDISNTMNYAPEAGNGSKLDQAKAATNQFIKQFAQDTKISSDRRVGVVTFNQNAQVAVSLQEANDLNDYTKNFEKQVNAITAPTDPVEIKFTNIEGGLQLASNILNASNATYKYVILLTDGFPTTYVSSDRDSTTKVYGYDTYMSHTTDYNKKYQSKFVGKTNGVLIEPGYMANVALQKPCLHGVDYSDYAAQRAQAVATTMKNNNVNIFSVGIGIGGMSIQNYLTLHAGKDFSTVDTNGMGSSYTIGSATNTDSYKSWLGDKIAGGPQLTNSSHRYAAGDSPTELANDYTAILKEIELAPEVTMREFYTVDPMSGVADFIGFYDKNGNLAANPSQLTGESKQNAENTADFGTYQGKANTIHWDMLKSGFTMNGNDLVFTLKYRVRLMNENNNFQWSTAYDMNNHAKLHYSQKYVDGGADVPDGTGTLEYPTPKTEGYKGSFGFTKVDAADINKKLSGATFTLTHKGSNCSVCKGDATIAVQTQTSDSNGNVSFNNIPSGHQYTLKETAVPIGYVVSSKEYPVTVSYGVVTVGGKDAVFDGTTFKNNPETITVKLQKEWDDGFNQDGSRPTEIYAQLLANGQVVTKDAFGTDVGNVSGNTGVFKIDQSTEWAKTVNNLPKYNADKLIEYNWVECYFDDGSYKPIPTTGTNSNKLVVTKEKNSQTFTYNYTVTSDVMQWNATDGIYHQTITNTYEPETVNITVQKEWKFPSGHGNINIPTNSKPVKLQLLKNNDPVKTADGIKNLVWQNGQPTYSSSSELVATSQAIKWEGLPRYENGEEIIWDVAEILGDYSSDYVISENYQKDSDGNVAIQMTNTYDPTHRSLLVNKYWDDNNNQDGIRPQAIIVQLYYKWGTHDWKAVPDRVPLSGDHSHVTLDSNNGNTEAFFAYVDGQVQLDATTGQPSQSVARDSDLVWGYIWEKLPQYHDHTQSGQKITYKVVEVGYVDADGKHTGLPKGYYGIKEYKGTSSDVVEDAVENNYWALELVNHHDVEKVKIKVHKVWKDDGEHEDIILRLYGNGMSLYDQAPPEHKDKYQVKLQATTTNWTYEWNVPKYHDGKWINWTVREMYTDNLEAPGDHVAPGMQLENGYTVHYAKESDTYGCNIADNEQHFVVTNTIEQEYIDISGIKKWTDDTKHEKVEINLYRDNTLFDTTTASTTTNWTYAFYDVPVYAVGNAVGTGETEDGHKYDYRVEEKTVDGYVASYDIKELANGNLQVDITNTDIDSKDKFVDIRGEKIWNDNGDILSKRPDSITVNLFRDGQKLYTTMSSIQNGWQFEFTGLEKGYKDSADGDKYKEYVYTIEEEVDDKTAEHYRSLVVKTLNGYDIINTLITEDAGQIQIGKVVSGNGPADAVYKFVLHVTAQVQDWSALEVWERLELERLLEEAQDKLGEEAGGTVENGAWGEWNAAKAKFMTNATRLQTSGSAILFAMAEPVEVSSPSSLKYDYLTMIDDRGYIQTTTSSSYSFDGLAVDDEKDEEFIENVVTAIQGLAKDLNKVNSVFLEALQKEVTTVAHALGFMKEDAQELLDAADKLAEAQEQADSAEAALKAFVQSPAVTSPSAITLIVKEAGGLEVERKSMFNKEGEYQYEFELKDGWRGGFDIEATSGSSIQYWFEEIDDQGADSTDIALNGNKVKDGVKTDEYTLKDATPYFLFTNYYESGGGGGGDTSHFFDRTVKKVWDDNHSADRPASVTVNLLCNGEVYKTVTLSAANSWQHTWEDLSASYIWTVEEVDVPDGYTSEVTKDGTTFVITNTLDKDNPTDPTDPTDPGKEPEKDPDNPADNPGENDEPGTVEPGTPVEPVTPEPDLGDAPDTGDHSNAVPFMALMAVAAAGLIITRRKFN